MKPKPQAANEGPLKVDQPFDQVIANVLKVRPPAGGWKEYEQKLIKAQKRKRTKI